MDTDYEYLAFSISSLAGLPVRLYRDGKFCSLYHHTKFKPDLAMAEEGNIFRNPGSVSYYMDEHFLYYGLFRVKGGDVALLIGPVAQAAVDTAAAVGILRTIGEPASRARELTDYFSAMPAYPLRTFLQILCTVNYFINGEKKEVSALLLGEAPLSSLASPSTPSGEAPRVHNTMELEQLLLSHVEHGRVAEIQELYKAPAMGQAGIMSADALRQQKNLIICVATLVTRAAIKGGLSPETAFALSDLYIQKAELMTDLLTLTRLNAQMVLDFTQRVAAEKSGVHNSKLVRKARDYILSHMGSPITTADLSRELGLNRTYLCQLFASETGFTVNAYVTHIKIQEAKRLMDVTQKTTAEIAEYLGYSSQSYFQRVFKKETGITPGAYRKAAGYH